MAAKPKYNFSANFFFAKGGELFTPTTRNALAGITRETIFELAEKPDLRTENEFIDTKLNPPC